MSIEGKVALVTGGARRIGRSIAVALARQGASVAINFNGSKKQAEEAVTEINRLKVESIAVKADISNAEEVERMVDKLMKQFHRIDILVNNAAIFTRAPLKEITEQIWDSTLDTNLKGTFLVAQKVSPVMLQQRSGKIINISSLGGTQPWPGYIPYCISKAGVIMLTKCLALALAPHIQVNSVAPGTGIFPEDFTDEQRAVITKKIPLKKFGSPEEIANMVVYLATRTEFITGQNFIIDGGKSIAL